MRYKMRGRWTIKQNDREKREEIKKKKRTHAGHGDEEWVKDKEMDMD